MNADTSGSSMTTNVGYDPTVGVYYTTQDQSWGTQDPSLQLAIGVMSFGIPKVCGIGVTANLGKVSAGASASGNGVGGNVNGHSAGTETPQNTGSGKMTVPIEGPNGTVPFSVHYNGSGPLRGVTSVDAGGTVKTRFGKVGVNGYVNVGTYTPNISDEQNCPD